LDFDDGEDSTGFRSADTAALSAGDIAMWRALYVQSRKIFVRRFHPGLPVVVDGATSRRHNLRLAVGSTHTLAAADSSVLGC